MSCRRSLVALSVAVLTIGGSAPVSAQEATPMAAPARPAAEQKKSAGRKVVRLEELRVEGRIQKPQALMLMPRASVASGDSDRNESFITEVKDATQKDPF